MTDDDVRAAIRKALEGALPGRRVAESPGTAQVHEVVSSLAVLRFAPAAAGEPWLFATCGAWEATRDDDASVEFFLRSPVESPTHQDNLSTATYFHGFYGLDAGKMLKVGRGWLLDSTCTRLLATAPREPLERLASFDAAGRRVRFLELLPITPDEEAFAREHGAAALEATFAKRRTNLLDAKRASVV